MITNLNRGRLELANLDNLDNNESNEVVIQNVRFYQAFLLALDARLAQPSSLLSLSGQSGSQEPIVFRFNIESQYEPSDEHWAEETTQMLNKLEEVKNEYTAKRAHPRVIMQEIFYSIVTDYPERALRVDGSLFAAEYEPTIADDWIVTNNVN